LCHGHAHQDHRATLQGVDVVGTPSTSVQFRPRSVLPLLDRGQNAGFRRFRLTAQDVQSELIRVPGTPTRGWLAF
jgi:hypothetical protein